MSSNCTIFSGDIYIYGYVRFRGCNLNQHEWPESGFEVQHVSQKKVNESNKISRTGCQVPQVVTFLSPIVGGHLSNLSKGHVFTIPQRSPAELPGTFFFHKRNFNKKNMQIYVCLLHTRTPFYGRFLLCRNQRYEKQEHAATTTWYAIDWIFTYLGVSVISRLNLVDVKPKKGIKISPMPHDYVNDVWMIGNLNMYIKKEYIYMYISTYKR